MDTELDGLEEKLYNEGLAKRVKRRINRAVSAGLLAGQLFLGLPRTEAQQVSNVSIEELVRNPDFTSEFSFRQENYYEVDLNGRDYKAHQFITPKGAGWVVTDMQGNLVLDKDTVYKTSFAANFAELLTDRGFLDNLEEKADNYRDIIDRTRAGEFVLRYTNKFTNFFSGLLGNKAEGLETGTDVAIEVIDELRKQLVKDVVDMLKENLRGKKQEDLDDIDSIDVLKDVMYGLLERSVNDLEYVRRSAAKLMGYRISYRDAKDLSDRLTRANTTAYPAVYALSEAYGTNNSEILTNFLVQEVLKPVIRGVANVEPDDLAAIFGGFSGGKGLERILQHWPKALDAYITRAAEMKKGEENLYGEVGIRDEEDLLLKKLEPLLTPESKLGVLTTEEKQLDFRDVPKEIIADIGFNVNMLEPIKTPPERHYLIPLFKKRDLNDDDRDDYIIESSPGNLGWVTWIYSEINGGYKRVGEFKGLGVIVASNKTNGYNDILEIRPYFVKNPMSEAKYIPTYTYFVFDGEKYIVKRIAVEESFPIHISSAVDNTANLDDIKSKLEFELMDYGVVRIDNVDRKDGVSYSYDLNDPKEALHAYLEGVKNKDKVLISIVSDPNGFACADAFVWWLRNPLDTYAELLEYKIKKMVGWGSLVKDLNPNLIKMVVSVKYKQNDKIYIDNGFVIAVRKNVSPRYDNVWKIQRCDIN